MRFGFSVAPLVILSTGLLSELTHSSPSLRGVAVFTALNATEFRWNVLFFWLACHIALGVSLQNLTYKAGSAVILSLVLALLSTGYGEHVVAEAVNAESGLWASPIHLLVAGLLPAGLLILAFVFGTEPKQTFRVYASLSSQALALACLGLLWNFYQTRLHEGWAWDWIEAGPCWLLLGLLWASHTWSKVRTRSLLSYVAFLCLSRTALITSAHHLQSPQNTLFLDMPSTPGCLIQDTFCLSLGLYSDLQVASLWPLLTPKLTPILLGFAVYTLVFLRERGSERHGLHKAQRQGCSLTYVLSLGLGLLLSHLTTYSILTSVGILILSKVRSYVRSLHIAIIAFFFVGFPLVWYFFDHGLDQSYPLAWVPGLNLKPRVSELIPHPESGCCALAFICWHVQGLLSTRKRKSRLLHEFRCSLSFVIPT